MKKVTMRNIAYVVGMFLLVSVCMMSESEGAGVCGNASITATLKNLTPCAAAAQSVKVDVSRMCCTQLKKLKIGCYCAVLHSHPAYLLGFKASVAVTLPKRCKIANRPVGYKCGGHVVP